MSRELFKGRAVAILVPSGSGGIKGTIYCYNIAPKDGSFLCEFPKPLIKKIHAKLGYK